MSTTTPQVGTPRVGTPRAGTRRGLRAGLAVLALAAGTVAFAPAAMAQTDSGGEQQTQEGDRPPRPRLTDEQRQCLEDAGVEKPAEGEKPTEEQRAAHKAAAERCGIELPRRGDRPELTDERKQCLEDAGVERPADGERPTEEQRAAHKAAAERCGIELPDHPNGPTGNDAPDSGNGGSHDDSENQSTSV